MVEPLGPSTSPVRPSTHEPAGFPLGSDLGQMYEVMGDLKETGNRYLKVSATEPLKQARDQLRVLSDKEVKAAQEAAKAADIFSWWSHASFIYAFASGGVSILAGACLLWKGQSLGWRLVASGSIRLTHAVLSQNSYCKELYSNASQKLSFGNPTVEHIFQSAFPDAITVISFAWGLHTVAQLPGDFDKKFERLEQFMSGVAFAINLDKAYTYYKKATAEGKVQILGDEIATLGSRVSQYQQRRGAVTDTNKRIENSIRRSIRAQINSTADFARP